MKYSEARKLRPHDEVGLRDGKFRNVAVVLTAIDCPMEKEVIIEVTTENGDYRKVSHRDVF